LQGVRRVLFNLPTVLAAIKEGKPIYIVEGEKDACRLNVMGFTATTCPMGAGKWRDEYSKSLSGANVIIIPDNDDPGKRHIQKVAKCLTGHAASIIMCDIASIWPDVPRGGDISDLLNHHKCDLAIIEKLATAGKPYVEAADKSSEHKSIFDKDVLESWLAGAGLAIRYNVISRKMEITGQMPLSIPREHSNALLPIIIHDAVKSSYKQCSVETIQNLLNVLAIRNRVNPVAELLASTTWDGTDRWQHVYSVLGITHEQQHIDRVLLKKWMRQCASIGTQDGQPAFGADGVLVLVGGQGIGKTSFLRKLTMHPNLFYEGATLDPNNKDSKIEATSVWICELGEIESTFRRDIDRLKAFVTASTDTFRVPYGRTSESVTRRTSFCATANSRDFLVDKTGNRRFWTLPIQNVDFAQLNALHVPQLWAQVWAELQTEGTQSFRLTRDEQAQLARRNNSHEKPLTAQEELEDLFYRAESTDHADRHYKLQLITITQFKAHHEVMSKYSSYVIKQALIKMERFDEKKIKGHRLVELPVVVGIE